MKTYRFSASTPPSHCGVEAMQRHCGMVASRHHCGADERSVLVGGEDFSFLRPSDLAAAVKRGSGHHCAPQHS